jgi:hypothetical protein
MEDRMARRPRTPLYHEPEADQDAQEAPQKAADTETVVLVKDTFLYGSRALAGTSVAVPSKIATVLRSKGIAKP